MGLLTSTLSSPTTSGNVLCLPYTRIYHCIWQRSLGSPVKWATMLPTFYITYAFCSCVYFFNYRAGLAFSRWHRLCDQLNINENTTRSQAVSRVADRTASQQTLTFRENYLCARSAFPMQSGIPNWKPLAQAVFEILRSKRIGVTSLTFQGHATSSVT